MRHPLLIVILLLYSFIAAFNACKSEFKPETTSAANVNNYSVDRSEEISRRFATTFAPDSLPYKGIGKLEKVPDSVVAAFKTLRFTNPTAHNKLLTLILLKLYLDHLRCCHQGYELRNNPSGGIDSIADPLLYEFAISTKIVNVNERIEFLNSGIGESWLRKNPSLSSDLEIKGIVAAMKPVEDSISKRLYW